MISSILGIVLASAMLAPATPQSVLKGALDHYRGLKSFSMVIQHHDSSGLFPGSYRQRLRWRKGDAFDLVVTKKTDYVPVEGRPGLAAPDYYCADGSSVSVAWSDRPREAQPVAHGSNTTPGWEVSGGLILSALLDSTELKMIFNPPPQITLSWTFGPAKQWQGEAVRDVQVSLSQHPNMESVHFYVSPDEKKVVGFSTVSAGKPAWAHYMVQVENGAVPRGVGVAPGK